MQRTLKTQKCIPTNPNIQNKNENTYVQKESSKYSAFYVDLYGIIYNLYI